MPFMHLIAAKIYLSPSALIFKDGSLPNDRHQTLTIDITAPDQYSKSSSTLGPLFLVTLSCFRYISTTCLLPVASSGFLSSRTLMNRGNRKLMPFSPAGSAPSLMAAL